MKHDIVIYGAGGLGRETILLIDEFSNEYNFLGFIDDNIDKDKKIIENYCIIGNKDFLLNYKKDLCVLCAIADPIIRKDIIENLQKNSCLSFPTLIAKTAKVTKYSKVGIGCIIYDNVISTVNVNIKDFCIIDVNCSLGHDCVISDYSTLYPSVNISGYVSIGECSEIGVGTSVIQGKKIGERVIIGAGSAVVNDIPNDCTAVGVPAKPIKFR